MFEKFKNKFLEWMIENLEKKADGQFPICPYAMSARLNNKIKFVDSRDMFKDTTLEDYEIIVYWLGDVIDEEFYKDLIVNLNQQMPNYIYFLSTPSTGYFTKNFTNCIFMQEKQDILNKRNILKKIGYYSNWPEDYYKQITQIL
jgi:hypothetical protein